MRWACNIDQKKLWKKPITKWILLFWPWEMLYQQEQNNWNWLKPVIGPPRLDIDSPHPLDVGLDHLVLGIAGKKECAVHHPVCSENSRKYTPWGYIRSKLKFDVISWMERPQINKAGHFISGVWSCQEDWHLHQPYLDPNVSFHAFTYDDSFTVLPQSNIDFSVGCKFKKYNIIEFFYQPGCLEFSGWGSAGFEGRLGVHLTFVLPMPTEVTNKLKSPR